MTSELLLAPAAMLGNRQYGYIKKPPPVPEAVDITVYVATFKGRTGNVVPSTGDYSFWQISGTLDLTSQISGTLNWSHIGGTPTTVSGYGITDAVSNNSPAFTGVPTAPTQVSTDNSTALATTAFVQTAVSSHIGGVTSFNGRSGVVVPVANDYNFADIGAKPTTIVGYGITDGLIKTNNLSDVTSAAVARLNLGAAPTVSPTFTGNPQAPTPLATDNSTSIATTAFVKSAAASIDSPAFTGNPTAPTPAPGDDDTSIATTAFVHDAVASAVVSYNGRTGSVIPLANDYTFTQIGSKPTTIAGYGITDSLVNSFNGRNGIVLPAVGDYTFAQISSKPTTLAGYGITDAAPLASPVFTGDPQAPTPALADNDVSIATTAFVKGQGYAPLASPVFTGDPQAPTPALADNDVSIATTAFVKGQGYAPLASPALTGTPTAPTPLAADNSTTLATTAFVKGAFGAGVTSFNTRTGAVVPTANDYTFAQLASKPTTIAGYGITDTLTNTFNGRSGTVVPALNDYTFAQIASKPTTLAGYGITDAAPLASPAFTGTPTAPTPISTDNTTKIATTAFVVTALGPYATTASLASYAPLASPTLTGNPTAPTPTAGDNDTSIATTAFVVTALGPYATTASLASYAPLASPALTGNPTAPTATAGDNDTSIATTAFVTTAVAPKAPLASPVFTGNPTGPTPATADSSVSLATTAFVKNQAYAPLASPALTGTPTAPTPLTADSSTTLATTAFVKNVAASNVVSFNTRTGAVVPAANDYTFAQLASKPTTLAGYGITDAAPLASPALTGNPTAPTALAGDNDTSIATTAFVQAALPVASSTAPAMDGAAAVGVGTTWARSDHVHPTDTSRAPLASPTFTGTPAAPTVTPATDSTTKIATTAFVQSALPAASSTTPAMDGTAAVGVGTTWARSDHVHPTDTSRAPLASPALTGTPTAPTPVTADNSTTVATTAFVKSAISGATAGVSSFNTRTGAVVPATNDYTFAQIGSKPTTIAGYGITDTLTNTFNGRSGAVVPAANDYAFSQLSSIPTTLVGYGITDAAPIASPTFTGDPKAPTPAANDNDTSIATTAFVQTAIAPKAPLASPVFTGDPQGPTPAITDNDTSIATTAFVQSAFRGYGLNFANAFRNGTFEIAQRGTSGTVTTAGNTSLDGWFLLPSGVSVSWQQQFNGFGAGDCGLELVAATGLTQLYLLHRLESYVAAQLLRRDGGLQPITVSFTIYNGSSVAFTPQLETRIGAGQDNWSSSTVDLAATNLQTIASGTIGVVSYTFTPTANMVLGYQIGLIFGGALNGSGYFITVSCADVRATPGLSTGLNSNPPIPERRPAALEFLLCQRYWRTVNGEGIITVGQTTTAVQLCYQIPSPMRIAPTVILNKTSVSSASFEFIQNGVWITGSGLSFNAAYSSQSQVNAQWAGFTGLTAPSIGFTNFTDRFFTLNADLF